MSLPGVPCIIIGHNDRIAWGVTNLGFDVQDLYIEKIDANTGRYLFHGQVEQARLERDFILVKGHAPDDLRSMGHAPRPADGSDESRFLCHALGRRRTRVVPVPLSRYRIAHATGTSSPPRSNASPGRARTSSMPTSTATSDTTPPGCCPIRRSYDGDVPVDGSSGDFEWDGFIPFEELPAFYNPDGGIIVTANQNPFPVDYPYRVNGSFPAQYRSRQIRDLLLARKGWKPADMLVVQKDVYSGFSDFLARRIVAACDRRHVTSPSLKEPVEVLRAWNGQMEKSMAAPLLATLAYYRLRKAAADVASPGKGDKYDSQIAPGVLQKIVENDGKGWFANMDETLVRCLADAFEDGRQVQGGNVKGWRYGAYNELTIKQPVGGDLPFFKSFFNIGPIEMSGSSTTVKQTTQRLGPSMRFIADLSNWDGSLNNLTIGESGEILSSHYKDQWNAYYSGASFPMQFNKVQAKSTLTIDPR